MRRFVCVALFSTCLALPNAGIAAADGLPDIATLRARVLAAAGTAPENYRETITWKSSDGNSGKEQTFKSAAGKRIVRSAGPIHWESGTFKGDDWHQNVNGLTVFDEPDPLAGAPAHETATVQSVTSPVPMLVISDIDANGLGTKEYIDPVTFRHVRDEAIDRSGTETTTYDAFASFGAQTLPAHWTVTTALGSETYTRTERVPDAATAADVAMPGGSRALIEFPSTAPVQIPADFRRGAVFVRTSINGHHYGFLLDSGSDGIVVDTDVAHQLGLPLVNRHINDANAKAAETFDAVLPEVKIGSLAMHNIVVSATKLANEREGDVKLAGVLGFDFFATAGITVDYEHQRLTVTPAASYVPPTGSAVVPLDLRLGDQLPMITVGLDGVPATRFIVDTGDQLGAYVVFDYFMDRHPKVGERSGQQIAVSGAGGMTTARPFFVHSFRLGSYNFADFDGYRLGSGSYENEQDGSIGTEFLVLFTLDFDYPHGRLYLTPTTNTKQMLHIH
jgi:predicted aspartyl protease